MYSYCMNDLVDETRGTTLILSSLKHTVFIYLFMGSSTYHECKYF